MKSVHAGEERETQIKERTQTGQRECDRNKWKDFFFFFLIEQKKESKKLQWAFIEKEMRLQFDAIMRRRVSSVQAKVRLFSHFSLYFTSEARLDSDGFGPRWSILQWDLNDIWTWWKSAAEASTECRSGINCSKGGELWTENKI